MVPCSFWFKANHELGKLGFLKHIDEANNLEPDASSDKFLSTVDLYKTSIEWFSCHTQLTEV